MGGSERRTQRGHEHPGSLSEPMRTSAKHEQDCFSAFHLNYKESNRVLSVFVNNKRLGFQATPAYLGVKLDADVPTKPGEHEGQGYFPRVAHRPPCWHLMGSCSQDPINIYAQALVFSTAEYCAPVWGKSTHKEAGCPTEQRLTYRHSLPPCHPSQQTAHPSWDCSSQSMQRSSNTGTLLHSNEERLPPP